jgi:hypothetical protein
MVYPSTSRYGKVTHFKNWWLVMAVFVLFGVLVAVSALAPFTGADRSDGRSVEAHPQSGWYPAA